MHDPSIVAFDIRWPKWMSRSEYGDQLLTVWHRDPETDGSDDSCGFSFPRLTKGQRERLKSIAWAEAHNPWLQSLRARENLDPVQCECLMRGAVELVSRVLGLRLPWDDVCRWAVRLTQNPLDNFRGSLCHLPGYHTNFERDTPERREESAYGLFCGIAAHLLRERRAWYKHPRWHFWHWRFQFHPLQRFKRWLFDRCCVCGGRFKNESPVSEWGGGKLWHMGCRQQAEKPAA